MAVAVMAVVVVVSEEASEENASDSRRRAKLLERELRDHNFLRRPSVFRLSSLG